MLRELALKSIDDCNVYKIEYHDDLETIPSNAKVKEITINHTITSGPNITLKYVIPNQANPECASLVSIEKIY